MLLEAHLPATSTSPTSEKWQAYLRWREHALSRVATLNKKAAREHKKMLKCEQHSRVEHGAHDRELLHYSYLHAQRRNAYRAEANDLTRQLTHAARLARVGIVPHIYQR